MFNWIFFAIFFLFAAVSLAVGVLTGKKYHWQFSVARIITVLVSLFLSILLASLTAGILGGVISKAVKNSFAGAEGISELFSAVPSSTAAIKVLAAMLIAPLLFIVFFVVTKILLGLTKKFVARLLMKIGKKDTEASEAEAPSSDAKNAEFLSDKKFDVIGAVCSALCSFIVFIAICAPIVGYFTTVNSALSVAGTSMPKAVTDITEGAAENIGSKAVRVLGGDLIFDSLTTYKLNGEKATLSDEVEYVSSLGTAMNSISNENVSNAKAAEAIKATAPAFEKAELIPTVVAEFVTAASYDWGHHNAFCGIAAPSLGEDFEPAMLALYDSLGSTTSLTIREDYYTIANSLALVIEHDAVNVLMGEGDKLHLFKDEALISGVMVEILNNERLSPAIEGFANAGVAIIANSLGVYDNADALYNGFIADMKNNYASAASASGTSYKKFNTLSNSVAATYAKYGIEISAGVSDCIAISMLDNKSLGSTESFELFFGADNTSAAPAAANGVYTVDMLASSASGDEAISIAKKAVSLAKSSRDVESFAKTLGETLKKESKFFASLSETERIELEAKLAANMFAEKATGKPIKYDTAVFANSSELSQVSVRITKEDLHISMANVSDKTAEANALAKVLSSTVDISDKINAGGDNMVDVVKSFGPVLDSFLGCQSIGTEGTSHLVTAIMQSDTVQKNIGFTILQSNEVASVINKNATTGDNYTSLLSAVGQTVDIIKTSSKKEDSTESVKQLISELTPSSAETLQQLSTPETVMNYGVPEENAQKVSDVLSDMFGQMSSAKESGMSEEKYQAEAEAVNDMISIAMTIGESDSTQTLFGSNGVTGITATEYVDRVLDSEVISTTVVNAAYNHSTGTIVNNPLGMAKNLTESEKSELVGAIESEWKSGGQTNDQKKLLGSIAAILGVEVEFSGSSVTIK